MNHTVLVVGSGVAGMRVALAARARGVDVALIAKVHPLRSHSGASQGGINAAMDKGDSADAHAADTVKAGDWLSDQDIVEAVTQDAPRAVEELDGWGVPFNRRDDGGFAARVLCGATRPRARYVDELTGHAIMQVVWEQVIRLAIPTYEEWMVTTLVRDGHGRCRGVLALELASGRLDAFTASAVVLATGGFGRAWQPSSAGYGLTGDGAALGYRAGARLVDMEMVQFHPLAVRGTSIVLTDALLGEGAYLVNARGERFASKVATLAELAPRDVLARAVEDEIASGRAPNGALLDLRNVWPALADRFEITHQLLKSAELDPAKDAIPVRAVAHRTMGGIGVALDGATAVSGLYAVGGCAASGLHGATALAGNSILEAVVLGARVGQALAGEPVLPPESSAESQLNDERRRLAGLAGGKSGDESIGRIRADLGEVLRHRLGLVRELTGLDAAGKKIAELRERYARLRVADASSRYNYGLVGHLELDSSLTVAEVAVGAALARAESRGAHVRADFPHRDDDRAGVHTVASYRADGPVFGMRPAVVTKWTPERRRY